MPAAKHSKRIRPVIEEEVSADLDDKPKSEPVNVDNITPEPVETTEKEPEVQQPVEPQPEPVERKETKQKDRISIKGIILTVLGTTILVAVVSGGFYTYFSGIKRENTTEPILAQETPQPTQAASPTPTPTIDVTKYTVSVLNGSGKIGEAGKARDLLKAAKFNVVNVGNADSYDYTDTQVKVAKGVEKGVSDLVVKALSSTYSVKVSDLDPTQSKADILVIVGSKQP